MSLAKDIIERLHLAPHPEGGWYSETWRAPAGEGERAEATAIYFLLEAGQRSHWHRVDAHEIWLWHGGDALTLSSAPGEAGPVTRRLLGPDLGADQHPQLVIPKGDWQAAEPLAGAINGYSLVSCIVAPGFEFSGFELAEEGWAPKG